MGCVGKIKLLLFESRNFLRAENFPRRTFRFQGPNKSWYYLEGKGSYHSAILKTFPVKPFQHLISFRYFFQILFFCGKNWIKQMAKMAFWWERIIELCYCYSSFWPFFGPCHDLRKSSFCHNLGIKMVADNEKESTSAQCHKRTSLILDPKILFQDTVFSYSKICIIKTFFQKYIWGWR